MNKEEFDFLFKQVGGIFDFDTGFRPTKRIVEVIFENKYTIIVDNYGNRYISRPERGEKYDEEKGLLVALAKFNGYSTTDLKELLEGAVRKNAKRRKKTSKKNKV